MPSCPCGKTIGDKYIVCYPCLVAITCPKCKRDKETQKPTCLNCWKENKRQEASECVKCNGEGYQYLMEDMYGPCDCRAGRGKKGIFLDK